MTRTSKLALVFYSLNIVDMVGTVRAIRLGYEELNPMMRHLLQSGIDVFIFYKVVVVGVLTLFLLSLKLPRWIDLLLLCVTVLYFAVTLLHLMIFWSEHV